MKWRDCVDLGLAHPYIPTDQRMSGFHLQSGQSKESIGYLIQVKSSGFNTLKSMINTFKSPKLLNVNVNVLWTHTDVK